MACSLGQKSSPVLQFYHSIIITLFGGRNGNVSLSWLLLSLQWESEPLESWFVYYLHCICTSTHPDMDYTIALLLPRWRAWVFSALFHSSHSCGLDRSSMTKAEHHPGADILRYSALLKSLLILWTGATATATARDGRVCATRLGPHTYCLLGVHSCFPVYI